MSSKEHLLKLAVVLCALLAPIKAVLLTTLILVVADLITGVWAAHKRKEPITSAGLRRTISKVFIYEVAVILGFITQKYLTGEAIPVQNIVSSFIGITEFLSVTENLNSISGTDLLKALLSKLDSANTKT